jgi:programmed cell death protein 5
MEPATDIKPEELPEGFTMGGGGGGSNGGPAGGAGGGEDAMKKQAIQEQKAMIMDQACTKEALARLGRIKLVKADKAAAVENMIVSMAMQGKLPGKITEDKLIEILERGSMQGGDSGGSSSRISIQRKNYGFDSDDDDNDDDLL